jgi:hypothetical protein
VVNALLDAIDALSNSGTRCADRGTAPIYLHTGDVPDALAEAVNCTMVTSQLTKWANANHALPGSLDGVVEDLGRAVLTVDTTSAGLASAFADQMSSHGQPTAPS